jgi:inorganic triphosphatase YgiF
LWYDASNVPIGFGDSVVADLPLQRSGVDLVLLFERFTALEIEAKFRVADRAVFTGLRQLAALGPFLLSHNPGTERQHNTYFDTADRRLTAARTTLRVRDLGSRRLATVKRSLSSQAGVHTREEWEVDLNAGEHPADWPASAARDRALAALNGAPIFPLMIIRTCRQYSYALLGDLEVAEISLDEGVIMAGERAAGFREMEVELLPQGTRADLDNLAAHLQARFALIPELRGKKKRGLALLDHAAESLPTVARLHTAVETHEPDDMLAIGV